MAEMFNMTKIHDNKGLWIDKSRVKRFLSEFKNNWRDGYWWKTKLRDIVVVNYFRYVIGNRGEYVMKKDWDNLIILDACRYDLFVEVSGLKPDYIISRGSCTAEFLRENFQGNKFRDTIYITANPMIDLLVRDCFYKVIPVWKYEWDEELNTVLPESIVKYAIKTEEKYPDKRLIIHFMQPHQPFIDYPELSRHGFKDIRLVAEGMRPQFEPTNPWYDADRGKLNFKILWKAYKKNLEIVLPHAFYLANKLRGRNVITSDHGEAFRRLLFPLPIRIAEHPEGIHIPELVKVPWLVIENGGRKKISARGSEIELIKSSIKKLKVKKKI